MRLFFNQLINKVRLRVLIRKAKTAIKKSETSKALCIASQIAKRSGLMFSSDVTLAQMWLKIIYDWFFSFR